MPELRRSGGGLEEGDRERVGHHATILHPRTRKWRVRTNSSEKAHKTRRRGQHGPVVVLKEVRPPGPGPSPGPGREPAEPTADPEKGGGSRRGGSCGLVFKKELGLVKASFRFH